MELMYGRELASQITKSLQEKVKVLDKKPNLAIIQVGDNFSSNKYIEMKIKKGVELNVSVEHFKFPSSITFENLKEEMVEINKNFDGIMIQLPLPKKLKTQDVCDLIYYKKDIDGLTSKNAKLFYNNKPSFAPATALAIMSLIDYYDIELYGKECGVVGQSNLVGKPISHMLEQRGAIVNRYDINTGINDLNKNDVVIVAAGVAKLVGYKNLKNNACVIDVGTNADAKNAGKLVGDVDTYRLSKKIEYLSPVPGGVGPLTVISLFQNLITKKQH